MTFTEHENVSDFSSFEATLSDHEVLLLPIWK